MEEISLELWGNKNDHIIGLIGYSFSASIFIETYYQILGISFRRIVWTKIWEIFGDRLNPPFPDDIASDCLIQLDDVDNLPFDDETLEELEYDAKLEHLDDRETSPTAPTSPIQTTHSSFVGDSLRTSSDSSRQVSNCLPDWDSYLSDITSLFVESHFGFGGPI